MRWTQLWPEPMYRRGMGLAIDEMRCVNINKPMKSPCQTSDNIVLYSNLSRIIICI